MKVDIAGLLPPRVETCMSKRWADGPFKPKFISPWGPCRNITVQELVFGTTLCFAGPVPLEYFLGGTLLNLPVLQEGNEFRLVLFNPLYRPHGFYLTFSDDNDVNWDDES